MAIKRYVEGQGWVEIANNSSSSGKALNISITDSGKYFDSSNVEGALAELGSDVKRINSVINDHVTDHPSGGSGPGGGSILPTITSKFEFESSDGKTPIEIPIFFNSPSLGDGTAYILVRNIEVATQTVKQGNNTIIVPPIGAGKNIPIAIYVKDRAGLISNQLTWVVTAGGIEIRMITDTKSDFSLSDRIAFAYNITCMSTEEIFTKFIFKGYDVGNNVEVDKEVSVKSINGYNSYEVTDLGVGIYKVEYWAESGDYKTVHYNFTLVIVDENHLLVSSDFDSDKEYESGVPISIPYRISIDRDEDVTVNLYINGALNKTIVTRPSYLYWSIPSLNPGDYTFKIEAVISHSGLDLKGELEFSCKVIEGEYSRIQPVMDASLMCWFDATDKTNNDTNRDIWVDKYNGNIGRLYNFNYGSNGWIKQEGSDYSELVMDGTCYVEIDMTPFKNNFKNGATIELVFKARDVGNSAARVLDITDTMSPFKGVYIDTREAYLATAAQTTWASIGEEEYIHVMYQIDRTNKYAHVIINGVITKSCKLSDTGTGTSAILESVAHSQKVYLNSLKGTDAFGSCEVKHLRIYERCLTFDEILQNYLSTIEDITIQKSKADFNDPLKSIMPVMEITCDPAVFDTMTDTNKVDVSMVYRSPNSELYGETLTTATNCLMYWQGTSSISYNIKNYNIELKDSNRQPIMYSPYPECIPQSLFCLKANLMESTNAHNVGLADYVRKYLYTSKNPAQKIDPKASRTVQGFPILLYINKKFEGLYDFNLDRYSTTAFGYDLPEHKNKCRAYEISANTNFTAGAFIPWSPETGVDEWTWYKNDFAGIYPPEIINPLNDDYAELKELVKFVHDSNDEVFITNFSTYFDKESVIRYYILVMVLGLVDSLGKNAKLVTYDGIKWYFEFYDMDTAMGLDNTGALKYDVDIEMVVEHFNTAESTLWKRVNELFHNDIIAEYTNMRNSNLTLDKIYECLFTNQIEKIPESQYNQSTQAKYLDAGEYLMMSNGNRYYNLKRWIKERLLFCDTLFKYSPTTSTYAQIRSGYLGDVTIDIETYYPMYVTIRWRNQEDGSADQTKKVGRNEKVRFTGRILSNDQEVLVYCAPHIKTISGLENFYPQHLVLNNANKITTLECPNCDKLINLQIEKCAYLQRIDISGCSGLGSNADNQVLKVSGCKNLRYLNAYGSSLTSIEIDANGGNLVELYVPKTLQTLSLRNQYSLKVVGIPGASSLEKTKVLDLMSEASSISSFTMINCPLVERLTYEPTFNVTSTFFDNYANERTANEINSSSYLKNEWKQLMAWGNGLANCSDIHIENSCYNVPGMSFRGITKINNLTLRAMPHLKTLLIGANCRGYGRGNYLKNDVYSEFDWNSLSIRDCPQLEEFRIHEMYPNGYAEGANGNLTYFTFLPGTDSINLAEKFPNLKVFECNCATQNIQQIILPQSLESIITCSWHDRHDEDYNNEVKLSKYNINSIFFEGEHDVSYLGIDLGNHKMRDVRITAPYATKLIGVDIVNKYVNPIFNEFKEENSEDRFFITPNGVIDVSGFEGNRISDWFAYIDFTLGECEIITPEDWDAFLKKVNRADRMFYYCTNPKFTWEFAMKFLPKVTSANNLVTMYQNAKLAEQQDYETDGVEMINNDYDIGGYNYGGTPFKNTNLKFVKSVLFKKSGTAYSTFYDCTSLEKVGDITVPANKNNANVGMNYLFFNCTNLKEVGNIKSYFNKEGSTAITTDSMFENCKSLVSVGEIDINSSSIGAIYSGCVSLTSEGLSLPKTTSCLNMNSSFSRCRALTEVTIDDVSSVSQANSTFMGCEGLKKVIFTNLTENSPLQEADSMFNGCISLEEVVIGGNTLPTELRTMGSMFKGCSKINKLPPLPSNFSYDVNMNHCCASCTSLTDENMYKDIPFRVISINNMYTKCDSLKQPVININSDHIQAKQLFYNCSGITELTVNFNGRQLKNSVEMAANCKELKVVNIKFPDSLLKDEYYQTGTSFYWMFRYCQNLEIVNFDMSKLANTNSKADFGSMFMDNNYIKEINGLDLTYLKKPENKWSSSQNTYDYHEPSITFGASYDNLETFGLEGMLSSSYDFNNITTVANTKIILQHLDTVTNETLGLTYNVMDAIDDEKTENVDQELKTLALSAIDKGWTFAIV